MKRIILILTTFLFILCSCGIFPSSKKESSSSSSYYYSQDNIASFEIIRRDKEEGVSENIVFSNGGLKYFEVLAKDINNNIIEIPSSSIKWESSNKDVFTVGMGGNISTKNNGEATLSASYRGHEAFMDITVKTIAYTFNQKEKEAEYRKGSSYYFPLEISPENASLSVEISDPSIIKLSSINNVFSVIGIGTCDITITAYTSYHGDTKTYSYQITTIDGRAPTFYFKNTQTNKGEITFAKNKYTSFSYSTWGIKALSYEGADITSSIKYHSGIYDFSKEGRYKVTFIVTDHNRNASSYFMLTMNITEYEEIAVHSPIKTFDTSVERYEFIKASDFSYLIKGIIFYIDIELVSDYEYAIGTIYWDIYFYIEIYSNSQSLPYNENPFTYTTTISKDSQRKQTLKVQFDSNSKLNPDTFSFLGSSVYLNGYAYYYRYY